LKRFVSLLTLLILNAAASLSAQDNATPALNSLKEAAAGFSYTDYLPAPEAPVFSNASRLAETLAGEELFDYLHDATAPAPSKALPSYSGSRAFMYSKGDNIGCNGGPGIITFYSQVCVNGASSSGNDYGERGDMNDDGVIDGFINAEHIWPQGYFDRKLPMVADLHHLAPTFVTPNGRRGNLKFAKVAKATYSTSAGSKLGSGGFEPADAVKGNVARAVMYFVVRYYDRSIRQGMDYNSFWVKNVPMLMEWNRQDPPDAAELRRNDLVEEFQGNRNPFIDNPALADRIGEMVFTAH